jgi:hypothetical protein
MTTPSSTSQSDFTDPGGITTLSFGPPMQVVHLLKTIGSFGIGRPDFACVVLEVEADRDQLADVADAGADPRLARDLRQLVDVRLLDLASPAGDSVSPSMSLTTFARLRSLPSASMIPGFSFPLGP